MTGAKANASVLDTLKSNSLLQKSGGDIWDGVIPIMDIKMLSLTECGLCVADRNVHNSQSKGLAFDFSRNLEV